MCMKSFMDMYWLHDFEQKQKAESFVSNFTQWIKYAVRDAIYNPRTHWDTIKDTLQTIISHAPEDKRESIKKSIQVCTHQTLVFVLPSYIHPYKIILWLPCVWSELYVRRIDIEKIAYVFEWSVYSNPIIWWALFAEFLEKVLWIERWKKYHFSWSQDKEKDMLYIQDDAVYIWNFEQ